MNSLNAKQLTVLKQDIQNGREKSALFTKMAFFGVDSNDRENIYNSLLENLKSYSIVELNGDFQGLQLATKKDIYLLINQGWTGDWTIKENHIHNLNNLRVFSMNERGLYFTAQITNIVHLKNGKYRVEFENAQVNRLANSNIKFTQNVVRITVNSKLSKSYSFA